MLIDASNPDYKDNTLLEDKLLWIARMYKALGINYVEISNTTLVKGNEEMLKEIKSYHKILPLAYKETGVKIRFLAALRRIPLTIVKDKITSDNYLRNNLDVLKAVCKDPYVVGADFVGEEINDIGELEPVIRELVAYSKTDPYFTIRIHAGENDSLKDNVTRAVDIVLDSLAQMMSDEDLQSLSYFEYATFLAALSFKKCDFVVFEAGVGAESRRYYACYRSCKG